MGGGMFAAGGATLNALKAARNAKMIARANEAARVAAEARERAAISERVRRNIQSSVNGRNASNFGAYAEKEKAVLDRVRDARSGLSNKVHTNQLVPNQDLRMGRNRFNKFVDDIKINGIQVTIKYVEYNGKKYIVDGHHRLQAAKRLGITEVPIEEVKLPYLGYKTVVDLLNWGN